MAYEIMKLEGGTIHIRIQGVMRLADQRALQEVARNLIEGGEKPRLLVVAEKFRGWEKEDGWDDVNFLVDYGDDIAKIAIVGDERWKEQAFLFTGKGLRTTEIEFFPLASLEDAERWLRE